MRSRADAIRGGTTGEQPSHLPCAIFLSVPKAHEPSVNFDCRWPVLRPERLTECCQNVGTVIVEVDDVVVDFEPGGVDHGE